MRSTLLCFTTLLMACTTAHAADTASPQPVNVGEQGRERERAHAIAAQIYVVDIASEAGEGPVSDSLQGELLEQVQECRGRTQSCRLTAAPVLLTRPHIPASLRVGAHAERLDLDFVGQTLDDEALVELDVSISESVDDVVSSSSLRFRGGVPGDALVRIGRLTARSEPADHVVYVRVKHGTPAEVSAWLRTAAG